MSNAQQVERFDQWLDKVNQVCGRFGANVLGAQFAGGAGRERNVQGASQRIMRWMRL